MLCCRRITPPLSTRGTSMDESRHAHSYRILGLLIILATVLSACAAKGVGNGLITGTLTYNERMTLAAGSQASVELVKIVGGSMPMSIDRTNFTPEEQPPIR